MRLNYYRFPEGISEDILREHCGADEDTIGGISVTNAKKYLKQFGGSAWTEHIDRDGSLFEVTPIEIGGNNSRFKYNHHL